MTAFRVIFGIYMNSFLEGITAPLPIVDALELPTMLVANT
jgi:hypothetical protein